MPRRVGAWTIDRRIGEGGMSSVWRVVDRRGEPGALKLLHPRHLSVPGAEASFLHEARALARLDHPCIVPVLDCGRVTPEEADENFVAGVPWLVLPVLSGGSVEAGVPDWSAARVVLRRVLRGLAHAHAHGLVHRDVKPANVLLPRPRAWAEARLGDFGLALELRPDDERLAAVAGTPAWMAPEQFHPDGREVDARADLYAVGGLAWTLVTRRTPYPSDTWSSLCDDHHRGALGGLEPVMDLPDGLEEWIRRLLSVHPADRPGCAAEALVALEALGEARRGRAPRPVEVEARLAELPTLIPATEHRIDADFACAPPTPRLPLPADWSGLEREARPVSLAVLRLRPPPFVGREAERARLWAWLTGEGPGVMIVEAPSGYGRTRLLRWLGDSVAEAGAGTVWWMDHGEAPGVGQGVAGMLRRWLRCEGLEGEAVDAWLGRLCGRAFGSQDVPGLAEIVAPGESPRVQFFDLRERLTPVLRLAGRATPVLLLADDAHWSEEALALTEMLLDSGLTLRVLLAMDPVKAPFAWRRRLADLRARPGVQQLALGPMGAAELRTLAEGSLGLSPTLAARLEARAQGSPRFVVDVVREWWTGGRLVETGEGLRLDGDERIPEALHGAWSAALLPLVATRPRAWRLALEIAATLGTEVDTEEWLAACLAAGVEAPAELVDAALHLGLVVAHPRGPRVGWRFLHGGFREVLLEHARARGRAEAWHLACAEAIRAGGGPGRVERLAGHLFDGGRPDAALPWLRKMALQEMDGGDRRRALALLDRVGEAIERAGLHAEDARRADLCWLRARARRLLGQLEEAAQAARAGFHLGRVGDHLVETVRNATELADVWRLQGRYDEAERLLAEMEPLAAPRAALRGAVLQRRGSVAFARGEVAAMLAFGDGARAAFVEAEDEVSAATALNLMGCGLAQAGRFEEARPFFAAAFAEQQEAGCRWGAADAANNLGYVLIQLGEWTAARPVLEESIALWDLAGSPLGVHPRLNLALMHLESGDAAAAEPHAVAALRTVRRLEWGMQELAVALATRWAVAARRGDPEAEDLRPDLDTVLAMIGAPGPAVERLLALGAGPG